MTAIRVEDLRKRYGSEEALRGISFEIEAGEVFGLLGPNGAGKTTTVEILEGYRKRDAGDVTVLGHDPERPGPEFREQIGVVLQQSPALTHGLPAASWQPASSSMLKWSNGSAAVPPSTHSTRPCTT